MICFSNRHICLFQLELKGLKEKMNFLPAFLLFSVYFKFSLALNKQEIDALKRMKTKWNLSDLPGEPSCTTWYRHLRCNAMLNAISLDIGFAKPELLSGSIPEALCNLTFLEELKLYGNRLSGIIPSCIGDLVHLKYLDFSGNCLGGEIPESLGNLTKMEYFDLSVNHHDNFSFSRRDLCEKSLKSNGLTGALPASLGRMDKVKFFYLSGNKLSGPIPDSIGNLSSVMYMYINANNISGSLPRSIGNLQNLQDLQLNKNNMSGAIPKEIGNCSSLRIIQMNQNHLSGEIPDTIGNLAQLQALELLDNELQGQIPEFKTTPVLDLNLFDVRNNNLSGPLPMSFGDAPLRYLFVSNNNNLKGIQYKLPDYIEANYSSSSVVDEIRHFDCPGFNLLSRVFKVTSPLIQLDPEYYNYTLCNCRPGFFGSPPNRCRTCLRHGICQGDDRTVESSVRSSMIIPINFYPVTDDAGTLKGLEECNPILVNYSLAACNPKDDCLYGKNGLEAESGGNCTLCAKGCEGRLCSKCSCTQNECFYHSHIQCLPCKKMSTTSVTLFFVALFITLTLFAMFHDSSLIRLLLIILLVSLALTLESGSWLYLNFLVVFILLIPATSNGLSSGLVKSLVFYLQTIPAIIPPYWYFLATNWFSRISFSNVNFIGLVCLFPQILGISKHAHLYRFILSLCAPVIIFLFVLIFLVFKEIVLYICRKTGLRRTSSVSMRTQILFSLVFIAYFSYFNASTLVISVFSCSADASGYEFMTSQNYRSVRCHTTEWQGMVIAAIIAGFVLILLPLLTFTFLLKTHKVSLNDPSLTAWLGYLYVSYKPAEVSSSSRVRNALWLYFEVFYMIYRFSLASCLAIQNGISQLLVVVLLIALLPVFAGLKPYSRPVDNYAAFASTVSLIITLFVTVLSKSPTEPFNITFLLFSVLALNGLTIFMHIVLIIWYGKENLKNNAHSLKERVLSYYDRMTEVCRNNSSVNQDPFIESLVPQ